MVLNGISLMTNLCWTSFHVAFGYPDICCQMSVKILSIFIEWFVFLLFMWILLLSGIISLRPEISSCSMIHNADLLTINFPSFCLYKNVFLLSSFWRIIYWIKTEFFGYSPTGLNFKIFSSTSNASFVCLLDSIFFWEISH